MLIITASLMLSLAAHIYLVLATLSCLQYELSHILLNATCMHVASFLLFFALPWLDLQPADDLPCAQVMSCWGIVFVDQVSLPFLPRLYAAVVCTLPRRWHILPDSAPLLCCLFAELYQVATAGQTMRCVEPTVRHVCIVVAVTS